MQPTSSLSAAPRQHPHSSATAIEALFLASRSRTAAESTAQIPDSHHGGSFVAATDSAPPTQGDSDGSVWNGGQGSGDLSVGLVTPYQSREGGSVAVPPIRESRLGTPSPVLAFGSFRPDNDTSGSEAPQPLYIAHEAGMKLQDSSGGHLTRPATKNSLPSVPPGYEVGSAAGWAVNDDGGAENSSYPAAEHSTNTQQSSWQMLLSGGGAGMQSEQQDNTGRHTLSSPQEGWQKHAAPTTPMQDTLLVQPQVPLDEVDNDEGYDDFDDILATLMS